MAESLDARLQRTVERSIAADSVEREHLAWIRGLPPDAIDDAMRQELVEMIERGVATFEALASTMKRQGRWIS